MVHAKRGDSGYLPSFQDYSHLVGYTHVQYADEKKDSATVEVRAVHKDSSVTLTYIFDGVQSTSSSVVMNSKISVVKP